MANLASTRPAPSLPQPSAVLHLLKPVTWFPPMWAFACGAISSGISIADHWGLVLAGITLSGPLVCATSQAVNDWYDRHVDAINEPNRPIPSGRIPGRWGLYIAMIWTALSLAVTSADVPRLLAALSGSTGPGSVATAPILGGLVAFVTVARTHNLLYPTTYQPFSAPAVTHLRSFVRTFEKGCRASGAKFSPFSVGRPRRGVLLG